MTIYVPSWSQFLLVVRTIDHDLNFFDKYEAHSLSYPASAISLPSDRCELSFRSIFSIGATDLAIYIATNTSQRCILRPSLQPLVFEQDTPGNYKDCRAWLFVPKSQRRILVFFFIPHSRNFSLLATSFPWNDSNFILKLALPFPVFSVTKIFHVLSKRGLYTFMRDNVLMWNEKL